MRNPKPSAAERLRLVHERGVVELQLVERLAQLGEVVAVDRVQARVDHRVRVPVAAELLGRRPGDAGDGVADAGVPHVLDPGDQVAHLAHADARRLHGVGRDDADLEHLVRRLGAHHEDAVAVVEVAVLDADVRDHAAVRVVHAVEDQRPQRGRGVAHRGGDGRRRSR